MDPRNGGSESSGWRWLCWCIGWWHGVGFWLFRYFGVPPIPPSLLPSPLPSPLPPLPYPFRPPQSSLPLSLCPLSPPPPLPPCLPPSLLSAYASHNLLKIAAVGPCFVNHHQPHQDNEGTTTIPPGVSRQRARATAFSGRTPTQPQQQQQQHQAVGSKHVG